MLKILLKLIILFFIKNTYAIDQHIKKQHLNVISFIESSNGKNINHKPVYNSVHNGDSAIGKFGLMPNTIKLLLKKNKKLNKKYAFLMHYSGKQIKEYLIKNPHVEYKFASKLYDYYAKKYNQNFVYISYAWHYGEKKIYKLTYNDIIKLPYVNKAIKYNEKYIN